MISKFNYFLLNILSQILGMFVLSFNKNITSLPFLGIIGFFLLLAPPFMSIWIKEANEHIRLYSILLVMVPVIFVSYSYYLSAGVPVGFQDVHFHTFEYSQAISKDGHIIFENAQAISYNFVSLYILAHIILSLTGLDIDVIASVLPPLLNAVLIISSYVIVCRLRTHKVAILTALLFGMNIEVLRLGQEFRTQTLGTIAFFLLLAMFLLYIKLDNKRMSCNVIIIILILFTATTSFVSSFFMFFSLISILAIILLFNYLPKWHEQTLASYPQILSITLIFGISFILYVAYMSNGFDHIVEKLVELTTEMVNSKIGSGAGVGNEIYGIYARYVTLATWLLFGLCGIAYLMYIVKHKSKLDLLIISAFVFPILFSLLNSIIFSGLNTGRSYSISFFIIALSISFGLISIAAHFDFHYHRCNVTRLVIFAIIFCIILSSIVEMPNYISGNMNPVRGEEPIDTVHYWDRDTPQYSLAGYLNSSLSNKNIHTYMLITNSAILSTSNSKNLTIVDDGSETSPIIINGDYYILHNLFRGASYTYRELLPDPARFREQNICYNNGDYLVYC